MNRKQFFQSLLGIAAAIILPKIGNKRQNPEVIPPLNDIRQRINLNLDGGFKLDGTQMLFEINRRNN